MSQIARFQEVIAHLPQIQLDTTHHFADGVYARELFIPAGCTLVGKKHKKEHFFILLTGDMSIAGEGFSERIVAPRLFISPPGAKRAGFAHVDSTCITFHRTDRLDLEEIEFEVIEPEQGALFDSANKLKELT